jgi:ABC-type glycerol-3-phosphate transport system permease component
MKVLGRLGLFVGLLALATPLLVALVASVMSESALYDGGSSRSVGLANYRTLFEKHDFWTPFVNSLVVSSVTTVLCVGLSSLAAYALARLRFAGRKLLLSAFLAVAMFPQISIVSPLFMVLRELSLIDSYPGLVLPYLTFAMPLAVWLLTNYFKQLPRGVEEAARLDGASHFQVLKEIVIPMALPGIIGTALVTFIYCWNEFLFALSFSVGREHQTLPVAIALFRGQYQVPWGEVLAATVVASMPVVALVLLFQRRVAETIER